MATRNFTLSSDSKQFSPSKNIIAYDAAAVARMVGFCLISARPRIQRETGETMEALRATAAGEKQPTLAVLDYFELTQHGARFVCA